jgi:hypothetical protein
MALLSGSDRSSFSHRPAAVDASRYAAAGGLITTPTDFAKFLIEVIQPPPAYEFHVSKKSRDEMIRPQTLRDYDGYTVSWGLGWRIVRRGSTICSLLAAQILASSVPPEERVGDGW